MGKEKKTWCGEKEIMRKAFLTVGYSGLSPFAPGTVGSFVSLILAVILLQFTAPSTIFLLSIFT